MKVPARGPCNCDLPGDIPGPMLVNFDYLEAQGFGVKGVWRRILGSGFRIGFRA